MPTFPCYHLTFRSSLHIGERGVGLEVTRTYVPADTLFSALCGAWRLLYGAGSLRQDLLDWFSHEGNAGTVEPGNEPLRLTSAFPFAGRVYFLPRPLIMRNVEVADEDVKAFKRVRFVSAEVFAMCIQGQRQGFSKSTCINGGLVWVTEGEKQQLVDWTDDTTGDIVLWRTTVMPRVTLDRITSASEIWHFGEVVFAEGCGLWFAVEFHPEHGDDLQRKFEASLRMLGDEGLGGERGAGHGLFDFTGDTVSFPDVPGATHFVTLSPVCPKSHEELAMLMGRGAAYELLTRRGWVTSPEGSNLRRRTVWMFAEGSVLSGAPQPPPGRLVDVTPQALQAHHVFRYGYAFPIETV